VLNELSRWTDLEKDEFIFLAGNKYRKYLLPHITNYKIPMEGLPIGKQLQWLTKQPKESHDNETPNHQLTNQAHKQGNCESLHQWFNGLKKYSFPFIQNEIPKNGIYILFEKGEFAHSINRIVRIGSHTGDDQLPSRLNQHFINENKDRSIFRKNIGRALLNRDNDSFLQKWDFDLTTREAKEKYSHMIDLNMQGKIEKRVTKYLQDNFSFVVFQIDDKTHRLDLESKIISTISLCKNCRPSENWLGNSSPKEKIRKSGLWQEQALWKTPLSETEMLELRQYIDQNQ
jgi:hypothetical protein